MIRLVRKYWAEILVFGAIFGVLLMDAAPNMTWMNTDSDGIHYVYSAKYLYPAHKTSAPLFLLLGYLFLKLPLGVEFWRMSLMSVLATTASAWFIYLIIKHYVWRQTFADRDTVYLTERNFVRYQQVRLYGIIGALVFGGSALVISQSIIVEVYALVTMFGLGAYYFAIKGKWLPCALMLGAGAAVHHLIVIPMIIMFIAYKELRRWKYAGAMTVLLLLYLYIPVTVALNNPPNMWGNMTGQTFIADNMSTALMLIGGLSIWDLPKRILDTAGILGVSLGLALIPIGYVLIRKQWHREPLLWLFLIPVIYYATNLAPQTYVYMMPAIGFGAIIAGIGLAKMKPYWKWAVLTCAVGMLIFNANYFDIGRTLDPGLSAKQYYNGELGKVPDGQILVAQQGWEWAATFAYNRENDRDIIPVSIGTLPSPIYQAQLKEAGIMLQDYPEASLGDRPTLIAQSILEMNDNVWITKVTTPETYGTEIAPITCGCQDNEDLLGALPLNTNPQLQWKPSNPYDIITGAIEVEGWTWIVFSNYSCLTFGMLGVIGIVPVWIGYMVIVRKKRWNLRRREK